MLRDEIRYKNKALIIDTSLLPGSNTYETMAMWRNNHIDIACVHTDDPAEAMKNHAAMVERFKQGQEQLPAKYAKLRDDIRAALEATEYLEQTEDGGTCNFDSPVLYLDRWNGKLVEQVAKEAGSSAFKWRWGRTMLGWVISPRSSGQGNRRTRRAEAMRDELKKRGYSVDMYYQMD